MNWTENHVRSENGGEKDEYSPFLEVQADFGHFEAKKSVDGKA